MNRATFEKIRLSTLYNIKGKYIRICLFLKKGEMCFPLVNEKILAGTVLLVGPEVVLVFSANYGLY